MFPRVLVAALLTIIALEFWFRFCNRADRKSSKKGASKRLDASSYLFENFARMGSHPVFASCDFASQSFFDEMQTSVKNIDSLPLEARNIVGDYINISGGERLTTTSDSVFLENDSERFYNENWVTLGGSTVLCLEVPDAFTWPSCLQAIINSKSNNGIKVHNFGQPGLKSAKISRLFPLFLNRYVDVTKVVVFFGVNDAGWIAGSRPTRRLILVFDYLLEALSVISKLFAYFTLRVKARRVSRASTAYANKTIKKFCEYHNFFETRGIQTFFILQPNVFCKTKPSNLEIDLINSAEPLRVVGLHAAYDAYLSDGSGLVKSAISTFSDIDETVYIDWCHVGANGNSLIAKQVWRILNGDLDSQIKTSNAMGIMKNHKDTFLKVRNIFKNKDEMAYNYPLF